MTAPRSGLDSAPEFPLYYYLGTAPCTATI